MRNIFFLLFFVVNLVYAQNSPYQTGFTAGTKEDLEVRLEWAKKDPCFNPGFTKGTKEFLELQKFRAIQAGSAQKQTECKKEKK